MSVSENLFSFEQTEAFSVKNVTPIFEEIRREVEEYLLDDSDDTDSTDGILDFIAELSDKIQKEFDEFTNSNSKKKHFKALTRIFTLLLNTKVDTPEKIKKILRTALKTTVKIWSGQN